ncbi:MAG: T9SS type A sorting domain-containing protein [Candidatus Delongbacteria bacterium]|nr:T9SS type A sorting domain-containing protein [Candidatus Delongbacteria bacterium]MCG2759952.1 T9SS type A sorting domain-containing protein [Candidatus Delongbacteria bacterium]
MKALFLILMIHIYTFGSVSFPSESYGARTYGLKDSSYVNISYPFDMGYNTVGDIDPDGEYINIISKYDSWQQKWRSASYIPELETWATNFMIHIGNVYRVYVYSDYAPSLGFAGQTIDIPSYNLTTYLNQSYFYKGYNYIMHHPKKSEILTATQLGNELIYCDWVVRTNPYTNEKLSTSYDNAANTWDNDFDIHITDPLMVNVWTPQTWPSESELTKTGSKSEPQPIQINEPMPVYYHIQNAGKGDYDFTIADSKNCPVKFNAWITGRENEVLTQDDFGCGYEQIGDIFSAIYINLGNFESKWSEGEEVNFQVIDETSKDIAGNTLQGYGSYKISKLNKPIARGFDPVIKDSGDPIVLGTPAGTDDIVPYETTLYQNYPNPFNPVTTIKYSLKHDGYVKLTVYNYAGQLVSIITDEKLKKGYHNVIFNAENLSSGVYYYTLHTENRTISKKMLIIK